MKIITLGFKNGEKHSIKWNPGIKYEFENKAAWDFVKPECMFALMLFFAQIDKDFTEEYPDLKSINGSVIDHSLDTFSIKPLAYDVNMLNDDVVNIIVTLVNEPLYDAPLSGETEYFEIAPNEILIS